MPSQYGNGSGPDVSEVVAEVSKAFRRNVKRFGPLLLLGLAVLLAAAGVYKIDPGEQGVVRRFGREHRKAEPGLHYRVPLVENVDIVNLEQIRRIEVGVRGQEKVPVESLMLTGDENIVEVQMIVQFRVAEANKYLFHLRNPIDSLHATAEVALRSMVGRTKIDDVITTGRERVQADTRVWLQHLMDEYESGLEVLEVKLLAADAPDEVRDAFHAVTRAREEKEKLINEARGYAEDRLPRARGEAQKKQREAEAYKAERVLEARGDAANFTSVLREYTLAKEVTRQRLYLETMGRILGRVDGKVFVDEHIAERGLPVLPLAGLKGVATAALEAPKKDEEAP